MIHTVVIPLAFVFLFATGFIAARFGVQDADPFILLLTRSIITLPLLMLVLSIRSKPRNWGNTKDKLTQMGVGSLLHGAYLGGVFAAIQVGMSAGVTALLVSLHPLFTAAMSGPVFGVKLNTKQWVGVAMGAIGVIMVLGNGISGSDSTHSLSFVGLVWCMVSLLGISSSTLWQKSASQKMGMVEGLVFQYLGALIVFVIAIMVFGGTRFNVTLQLVLTLGWLIIAISIGAIWLLMIMIERGEAHQVAKMFFLVPPCAAFMAWVLFDEQWTPLMLMGAALIIIGIALDTINTNKR